MDGAVAAFPEGLRYDIPYDTTRYHRGVDRRGAEDLVEAMLLVLLVVFCPAELARDADPDAGRAGVARSARSPAMYLLGFSINTLTLFGMVLAIGIVVDDAIVVLENVERIMTTEHMPPREATVKAMQEVTRAGHRHRARAVRRVPAGGLPRRPGGRDVPAVRRHHRGLGGDLRLRALTLTPALCAIMLQPEQASPGCRSTGSTAASRADRRYTTVVRFS